VRSNLSRLKTDSILSANVTASRADKTEEPRKCDEILENHLDFGFGQSPSSVLIFTLVVCSL
jgi:hypothetical protein